MARSRLQKNTPHSGLPLPAVLHGVRLEKSEWSDKTIMNKALSKSHFQLAVFIFAISVYLRESGRVCAR